jgi:hypothetical protein
MHKVLLMLIVHILMRYLVKNIGYIIRYNNYQHMLSINV